MGCQQLPVEIAFNNGSLTVRSLYETQLYRKQIFAFIPKNNWNKTRDYRQLKRTPLISPGNSSKDTPRNNSVINSHATSLEPRYTLLLYETFP